MESLIIQADENMPSINFNPTTGRLVMEGLAVPENVYELFNPLKDWLEQYANKPQPATELIFFFEYLNTAASKMVFEIGNIVSNLHGRDDCDVKIIWKYTRGDVEMHELGEEMLEEYLCFTEIRAVDEI